MPVEFVQIFVQQMSSELQIKETFPRLNIRKNAGIAMPVFWTASHRQSSYVSPFRQ